MQYGSLWILLWTYRKYRVVSACCTNCSRFVPVGSRSHLLTHALSAISKIRLSISTVLSTLETCNSRLLQYTIIYVYGVASVPYDGNEMTTANMLGYPARLGMGSVLGGVRTSSRHLDESSRLLWIIQHPDDAIIKDIRGVNAQMKSG
jgi:hypothetical protein